MIVALQSGADTAAVTGVLFHVPTTKCRTVFVGRAEIMTPSLCLPFLSVTAISTVPAAGRLDNGRLGMVMGMRIGMGGEK